MTAGDRSDAAEAHVSPHVVAERGWALFDLHRYDEAAAVAESGLAEYPDDAQLLGLLGTTALAVGDTKRALQVARSCVAANPDSDAAHLFHSTALRAIGRNAEAADAAQQAVALSPWWSPAHEGAADAYIAMMGAHRSNRDQYLSAAVHHSMTSIQLDPMRTAGPICMASIALLYGEWSTAEQWGRRALELDPTDITGHQVLGLAAQGRGDRHAAGEHLVDAGRLDPRSGSNTQMLKDLVASGPTTLVLLIAWFVVVSLIMNVREDIGPWWTAAALAPLFGLLGGFLFWNRERRRSGLSERALAAIDTERRIESGRTARRWGRRR